MTEKEILNALQEAYKRAGTQGALAKSAGLSQSTIAQYLNGTCAIGNMTLSVFLRLFPNIKVDFFGGKTADVSIDAMQEELIKIFNNLSPADKARCLAIVAANFPNKIIEESKR